MTTNDLATNSVPDIAPAAAEASEKRGRRVRVTGTHVTAALLLVLVSLLAGAVLSGNWQIRPVLSGSMRPGFSVGGVVVTEREPLRDLQLRSVIVTHPPGEPHFDLIHRIIQIESQGADSAVVQTMGDDNPAPDPFHVVVRGPWIYVVRFSVPWVGYPALWAHSPRGRQILLGLAVILALFVIARTLLARRAAPAHRRRGRTTEET